MKKGQALVILLIFIAMGLTVVVATVSTVINNSIVSSQYEIGQTAYFLAESGAEEAILRLLRDPEYMGGTLTMADGSITITVTGVSPKTILSTSTVGTTIRKIQVIVSNADNILTVLSWREI